MKFIARNPNSMSNNVSKHVFRLLTKEKEAYILSSTIVRFDIYRRSNYHFMDHISRERYMTSKTPWLTCTFDTSFRKKQFTSWRKYIVCIFYLWVRDLSHVCTSFFLPWPLSCWRSYPLLLLCFITETKPCLIMLSVKGEELLNKQKFIIISY